MHESVFLVKNKTIKIVLNKLSIENKTIMQSIESISHFWECGL